MGLAGARSAKRKVRMFEVELGKCGEGGSV